MLSGLWSRCAGSPAQAAAAEAAAAPFLAAGMLLQAIEAVQLLRLAAVRGAPGGAPAAAAALEIVAVLLSASAVARAGFFGSDGRMVGLQVWMKTVEPTVFTPMHRDVPLRGRG